MDPRKAAKLAELKSMIDSVPLDGGTEYDGMPSQTPPRKKIPREASVSGEPEQKRYTTEESAYKRIVELCGYHEFCQAKMRERLKRDGIADDLVESAIGRAVRVGLIDDLRWGEMRVSALMHKGMGCNGITRELRENGIDASRIDGWPYAFIERHGDDFTRALELVRKCPPKSKNPRASAYAKLVRKGYSHDVAGQVSAVWYEESMTSRIR